jgi:predicted amidohydrolase
MTIKTKKENNMNRNLAGKSVITVRLLILLMLLSQVAIYGQIKVKSLKDTLSATKSPSVKTLHVAAVQMRSSVNLADNVAHMKDFIHTCATKGVRIAVFPECALSGYFENVITSLTSEQISIAEKQVAETCRKDGIYAIIGMPWREGKKLYNSAAVISPEGKVIERYHKVQLAEKWPDPGDHLSVFRIDNVPCSIIICHDERYPELVRLPVLAGAEVIFYISHESDLLKEDKINPYRAQIQARAVENNVYVVHSNAPANQDLTGSHGQSRIIAPDGNIMQEASIFGEEVLNMQLDITKSTRENAKRSLTRGPLQDWWKEGVKQVRIVR